MVAAPLHQRIAKDRQNIAYRNAQPRRKDRWRVLCLTNWRGRVLPLRFAGRRSTPPSLVPCAPSREQLNSLREPFALDGWSHRCRPALARRIAKVDRHITCHEGFPFHGLPSGKHRQCASVAVANDLHRRPRLRNLDCTRIPALLVRPDLGSRKRIRHALVRFPRAHHYAPRKELRHLVPRVPPHLHTARGRHGSGYEARPRLHWACSGRSRNENWPCPQVGDVQSGRRPDKASRRDW